ncbi:hypothetical protein JCM21714_596 [Gracilibacillus boraciitolerans JCM 21714]|uniref:Uncharacterized protein n=1 Tax=Gracilibacillus boraciitolerans JCM 21714 TaxID=1298598 RepID=W4VFP5_9BACI|nr:hypothetical protein [Gracilibacillus boraciitolerans]GAE91643.1 hypothetical protein JCM21714_596 [Gracilibacillus boraciitolerans JCM 21714]
MDKREWRLILLHHIKGVSRSLLKKVIKLDPDLVQSYQWSGQQWQEYFHLSEKKLLLLWNSFITDHYRKK